jgi:hypothetical protein
MAAWNSSSLAFSDHNASRQSNSGLLKNLSERISKQHLVEHKLFKSKRGSTGKDFGLSKMFRKKGKGVGQQPNSSPRPGKNMKYGGNVDSSSISPSTKEFDRMMSSISGKSSKGFNGSGKRLFQRKSFG